MTRSSSEEKRISRRQLLRGALIGGSGLLAAYAVGCGDDDKPASPTASPAATTTRAPATGAPTPAPTPGVMRWRHIEASGNLPSGRTDHSLVSDGRSLYLFGGRTNGAALSDYWVYDIAAASWTEITGQGGPPARFGHNAVFEEIGRTVLIFGGQALGSFFNDVWTFDTALRTWSQRSPRGDTPSSRYGAASALQPPGRVVVSHGFTNAGRFDDTWSLALGIEGEAWGDVSATGTRPIKRCLCRGAWDSVRHRFLMFGGQTDGTPFLGDLWAFDGQTWTEIASEPKPSPRNFSAMAETDPGRIALFGGNTVDVPGPMNDLWFFDSVTDSWTLAQPEGEAPSARYGHDAVWLPESRRLIIFGGHDATGDLNDLWELTLPA